MFDVTHSRILVTGGLGFIARHFIEHLLTQHPHAYIWNIDCVTYCSSTRGIAETIQSGGRYTLVKGNINDTELVEKVLEDNQIDVVYHLAAASHVEESFYKVVGYAETNIMGTLRLLEAVRRYGKLKRFIHISTDEVYGETDFLEPVEESFPHAPTNPYAASKSSGEMLVLSYVKSFQFPAIVIRPCNVFGPGQHPEKLIGCFATQLRDGKPFSLQGDGSMRRCFMYVKDTCDAILFLSTHGEVGQAYNIASDHELSVREVGERCIKIKHGEAACKDVSSYFTTIPDRPFNDRRYYISGKRLKEMGWKPQTDFDDAFRETVLWYLERREGYWGS